jgi:hypothetical protein
VKDHRLLVWELGAGPSCQVMGYKCTVDTETITRSPSFIASLQTNGKIGLALSDKASVFVSDACNVLYPGKTLILNNTIGLDLLIWLWAKTRVPYIGLGAGYAAWVYPLSSEWNTRYGRQGFAISVRAGYELIRHISLELGLSLARQTHEGEIMESSGSASQPVEYTEIHTSAALSLRIVYMGY